MPNNPDPPGLLLVLLQRCKSSNVDIHHQRPAKTDTVMNEITPQQVNVRISTCPKCKGWVRVAIEHEMDKKDKQRFLGEVMRLSLNVDTISLQQYREQQRVICKCK